MSNHLAEVQGDTTDWKQTAEQAIRRISSAEKLAGLTHSEHVLRALPGIRDRVLHLRPLSLENLRKALDEIEAELKENI